MPSDQSLQLALDLLADVCSEPRQLPEPAAAEALLAKLSARPFLALDAPEEPDGDGSKVRDGVQSR